MLTISTIPIAFQAHAFVGFLAAAAPLAATSTAIPADATPSDATEGMSSDASRTIVGLVYLRCRLENRYAETPVGLRLKA